MLFRLVQTEGKCLQGSALGLIWIPVWELKTPKTSLNLPCFQHWAVRIPAWLSPSHANIPCLSHFHFYLSWSVVDDHLLNESILSACGDWQLGNSSQCLCLECCDVPGSHLEPGRAVLSGWPDMACLFLQSGPHWSYTSKCAMFHFTLFSSFGSFKIKLRNELSLGVIK